VGILKGEVGIRRWEKKEGAIKNSAFSESALGKGDPDGAAMAKDLGYRCQCSGVRILHLGSLTPDT